VIRLVRLVTFLIVQFREKDPGYLEAVESILNGQTEVQNQIDSNDAFALKIYKMKMNMANANQQTTKVLGEVLSIVGGAGATLGTSASLIQGAATGDAKPFVKEVIATSIANKAKLPLKAFGGDVAIERAIDYSSGKLADKMVEEGGK
jgi:hypothetical protein